MKALTLTQPWATLVAIGAKRIETRSWGTKYRGPLAIHAAKARAWLAEQPEPVRAAMAKALADGTPLDSTEDDLPLGAIVAVVKLEDVHRIDTSRSNGKHWTAWADEEPERFFGNYAEGRYMWALAHVEQLRQPIECRGYQGLWDVPDDIAYELRIEHERANGVPIP